MAIRPEMLSADPTIGPSEESLTARVLSAWRGPASLPRQRGWRLGWTLFKRSMVPAETQRFLPTTSGYILIILAVGLCAAAYNTTSNILFMTLSILLACFIVSGLLSWVNFRAIRWRLVGEPPYRVGQQGALKVELENQKRYLTVRAVWFNLTLGGRKETHRMVLREPLEPGRTAFLEWMVRPGKRGVETIKLSGILSQYPYGFLRKSLGAPLSIDIVVWPERVRYTAREASYALLHRPGEVSGRPGQGDDLIQIRKYEHGDSFHLVHWKATARTGTLMIRKMSGEDREGVYLWLDTARNRWATAEQFENFLRLAATLAEDLFARNQFRGYHIDDEIRHQVRRHTDLEGFLSRLALLQPNPKPTRKDIILNRTTIEFHPYGQTGINARLGGAEFASL